MSAPIYDPYADYEAQEIRRSVVANPDTITHNLCSYEAQGDNHLSISVTTNFSQQCFC